MTTKLQRWMTENKPSDEMVFQRGYWNRNIFLRDKILPLFFYDSKKVTWQNFDEYEQMVNDHHDIIGTHWTKSIRMPVLKIVYKGWEIVLRYNFYNYEIAVVGKEKVNLPIEKLFCSKDESFFYEGFPDEYRLTSYYEDGNPQFMAIMGDDYQCYTFIYLLKLEIDRITKENFNDPELS